MRSNWKQSRLVRFTSWSPVRYAFFDVTLRYVQRRSTVTRLTLKSARCAQRRRTITKCPSAELLQLQTGQWECALLHARYTLDRTGYGQTADIWSWKGTPGLYHPFSEFPLRMRRLKVAFKIQPVDYRMNERLPIKKNVRAFPFIGTAENHDINCWYNDNALLPEDGIGIFCNTAYIGCFNFPKG